MTALRAARGDNGLMDAAVIDVELAGMMGEDGRGLVLGDLGFDALGDLEQRHGVERVVRQIIEADRGGAEDVGGLPQNSRKFSRGMRVLPTQAEMMQRFTCVLNGAGAWRQSPPVAVG